MVMNDGGRGRRSIRLRGYDYGQAGAYFVTICTQDRARVFGVVVDGQMRLSAAGRMVDEAWREMFQRYHGMQEDAFVVMPDHVHGVVVLQGRGHFDAASAGAASLSLDDVVKRYKSWTTRLYLEGVQAGRWPPVRRRLWQRNYYERIVRDADALDRIRAYIHDNPCKASPRSAP